MHLGFFVHAGLLVYCIWFDRALRHAHCVFVDSCGLDNYNEINALCGVGVRL